MKKIFTKYILVFSFLLTTLSLFSQSYPIQITLIKKPPHLFRFDNVEDFSDQIFVSVVNTSKSPVKFNLNFTGTGPNGLGIDAPSVLDDPIELDGGEVLSLTGQQFDDYGISGFTQDIVQPAKERDYLLLSRLLREGKYSICLTATVPENPNKFLSDPNEGCDYFEIVYGEPPYIVLPENKETIKGVDPSILNVAWTHNIIGAPSAYDYAIKIVDITNFGKIDPIELLERPSTPVVYEEEISGQLFVALTDLDLISKHIYAIRVTALDPDHIMEFEQGGKSNVVIFDYFEEDSFVTDTTTIVELDPEPNAANGCDCTENMTQPQLVLERPNAERDPRKIQLNNIDAVGNYLISCNNHLNSSTHEMSYAVHWNNTTISTTNNFIYAASTPLPNDICVDYTISEKSSGDIICEKTYCIDIPDDIFDEIPTDATVGTLTLGDTITAGENKEFKIITTQLSHAGETYTGQGNIFIEWMQARVQVEFDNIKVDDHKQLLDGIVTAVIAPDLSNPYPKAWALDALASNTWTNDAVGSVVDWVEGKIGRSLPYRNPNVLTQPINMPFGISFNPDNQFIISEMNFSRNRSKMNIIVAKTTPADWGSTSQTIGFKATDIKFHPNSLETSPRRLELVADLDIGAFSNKMDFKFIAPSPESTGCFIEWNDTGFSKFGIEIESSFSRNWIVPVPDDGISQTKFRLATEVSDWNDLILEGNLPKSKIVGSNGVSIRANAISFDMSDVMNPRQILFPSNYSGEQSNLFRGFFAKNITIELPKAWQIHDGGQMEISAHDLIIDNMGITMVAEANNVASFNTTTVVDLGASIDQVVLKVRSNSLTEASITGQLVLPISNASDNSSTSKIDYVAVLQSVDPSLETVENRSHFQLTMNPSANQVIDFNMIHSNLTIQRNSEISAYIDDLKKSFELKLNAEVNINDIDVGPFSLNSLGMQVENMTLAYDSQTDHFDFDKDNTMAWKFNSPQKFLSDSEDDHPKVGGAFPFSIKKIYFDKKPAGTKNYLKGDIKFDIRLDLANNISGATTIAVQTAIEKGGSVKFIPKYIGTKIDSIAVSADLKAVKINGNLVIKEDDTYGKGFKGELQATFEVPKTTVKALAEFGHIRDYNYWRVEGGMTLPVPIPIASGVNVYGFGGGAYYNMKSTVNSSRNISDDGRNMYDFRPDKGKMGFNLLASIGAAKIETFNSDVEIRGSFGDNVGLSNISIGGNFWIGADIPSRSQASIFGNMLASYDFVENIFEFNSQVSINRPPITTPHPMGLSMYVNGKTHKWYMKFGEPRIPNMVNVGLGDFSVNVNSYYMFGNDIPIPDAFSSKFVDGYKSALGHAPRFSPTTEAVSSGSNAQNGSGIANGIGFDFKAGAYQYVALGYYAGVSGRVGAELNLSLLEYPDLKARGKGLNGWQAGGSIGFYTSISAGAYTRSGGNYHREFTLVDFAGGGYVIGRFPNPTWMTGEVAGRVKFGCVKGHCILNESASIDFTYGEDIDPGEPATDLVEAKAETEFVEVLDPTIQDIDKYIVQYIHPQNYADFPVGTPIAVKYNTLPNKTFEIEEDNGTVRLFRFSTEALLFEKNPLTCTKERIPLFHSIVGGEYLYTGISNQHVNVASMLSEPQVTSSYGTQVIVNEVSSNSYVYTGETNISGIGSTDENSNEGDGEATMPVNFLAPNTYYEFIISTVLKELKNGHWETVLFDGKEINESFEMSFFTESGNITNEQIECDNLYHQMTLDAYMDLSPSARTSLRGNDEHFYISDDGKCRCPRIDADELAQNHQRQEAMDRAAYEIGQARNRLTTSDINDLLNGFGSDFGTGTPNPTDPTGGIYGQPSVGNNVMETENFDGQNINVNTFNSSFSGSFNAFGGGFQNGSRRGL